MTAPRILITGSGGMLARDLAAAFRSGHDVVELSRADLDITNANAVRAALVLHQPDVVIQGAAFTRVDDAELHAADAHAVNADGAAHVARACAEIGARFIYPSSDYVFDGRARTPYTSDAPTNPINVYGATKLAGEAAAALAGDWLVIRTSWLYGAGGRNFVRTVAERRAKNLPMKVVDDQHGSPTWTGDLAPRIAELVARKPPSGIYHMTSSGQTTWYRFALEIERLLGFEPGIEPCSTADFPTPAKRPAFSVLDCAPADAILGAAPDWRVSLERSLEQRAY